MNLLTRRGLEADGGFRRGLLSRAELPQVAAHGEDGAVEALSGNLLEKADCRDAEALVALLEIGLEGLEL